MTSVKSEREEDLIKVEFDLLIKIFGPKVVNDLICKYEDLDHNGRFIVEDNSEILFRGSREKCLNFWADLPDCKAGVKVAEIDYDIKMNIEEGTAFIPEEWNIISTVIEY